MKRLTHIPNQGIWLYLKEYLADIWCPTVFEFGAHHGEDTHRILKHTQGLPNYIAFEADNDNFRVIQDTMVNQVPVAFINAAIGKEETPSAVFHKSYGYVNNNIFSGGSSLKAPTDEFNRHYPKVGFKDQYCRVVSLDKFCETYPDTDTIHFIWSDIQGGELDMLKGGKNMIPKTGLIYMEYISEPLYEGQPTYEELIEELGPGWEVIHKWPGDVLVQNVSLL